MTEVKTYYVPIIGVSIHRVDIQGAKFATVKEAVEYVRLEHSYHYRRGFAVVRWLWGGGHRASPLSSPVVWYKGKIGKELYEAAKGPFVNAQGDVIPEVYGKDDLLLQRVLRDLETAEPFPRVSAADYYPKRKWLKRGLTKAFRRWVFKVWDLEVWSKIHEMDGYYGTVDQWGNPLFVHMTDRKKEEIMKRKRPKELK